MDYKSKGGGVRCSSEEDQSIQVCLTALLSSSITSLQLPDVGVSSPMQSAYLELMVTAPPACSLCVPALIMADADPRRAPPND